MEMSTGPLQPSPEPDCDGAEDMEAGKTATAVQLVLAEKRTSLALLRTGIAVMALPITALSFLVATSKYYDILDVLPLIVPLFVILALLAATGIFLIVKAILKIRREDAMIARMRGKHDSFSEFID